MTKLLLDNSGAYPRSGTTSHVLVEALCGPTEQRIGAHAYRAGMVPPGVRAP